MRETRKLTRGLSRASARLVVVYLDDPTVDGWHAIENIIVGPVGFTLRNAIMFVRPGFWPVIRQDGSYDIPDAIRVARGLLMGQDLSKPLGGPPPEGTPGAGAGEVEPKQVGQTA